MSSSTSQSTQRRPVSIETVRLSQTAKGQLLKLKRITGIKNWNILCRWGLCIALADPSPPLVREIVTDSNVEMTWKTFAGAYGDIYLALLRMRCEQEGGDPDDPAAVAHTLTVHLHRGIGLLAGRTDLTGITDLIALAISQPLPSNAPGVIE
ncbi:DNA sulfur modification protein DndE [uncultured Thermomonospora sp.]|uniref:DNA sulfur modification protein DndE n=1 Tax=uncultured Thermomonospora sp. TaxID=671175 RepID=UPI00259B4765|nr:DNA sulfur modification protein DndE [uncultured Thermomonospora sp.]